MMLDGAVPYKEKTERCGERDTFHAVYERNIRRVYRLCYLKLGHKEDAEDAAQNVFVRYLNCEKPFASEEHERAYLDQRTNYIYQNPYDAMALVDALGNTYPLKECHGGEVNIFSITETPVAEIVGFRADYLAFTRDFSWDGESVTVELPLPADGEAMDVDLEFVFPDGVTKGKVRSVGYNTTLGTEKTVLDYDHVHSVRDGKLVIDRQQLFGMGYYAVVTEAVEQNGVQYWTELFYTDDYCAFLEPYLVDDEPSPYDAEYVPNPMSPMHLISMMGLENAIQHIEHYIPDGRDTVTMKADYYSAIAYGDWDIDFTE